MPPHKLHSFGVIPLRKGAFEIEVLLIDQINRLSPGTEYWTFPKGTPEKSETGLETAIRETKEETGVVCESVDDTFAYDQEYTFEDEGTVYEKKVTYFIGRSDNSIVQMQESEVKDFTWLPLDVARERLTRESAHSVIDAIVAHLPHSRLFAKK